MVNTAVITALLIGFLAGIASQHIFTTSARAWSDAKEKAQAQTKKVRWDG